VLITKYLGGWVKEVEMDGACFVVGEEECMHDFGGET
jgi:hypothetical protein